MNPPAGSYRERLHVPLRWWVQGSMLVVAMWLAMVVALPGLIAWPVTALFVILLVAMLSTYGSTTVSVGDDRLQVGRAQIEARFLGAAEPLDAEQTRRVAGRDADARAYLMLRPYVKRAVKVEINDPADPAPYWLVSSRHPDVLAGALARLAADLP